MSIITHHLRELTVRETVSIFAQAVDLFDEKIGGEESIKKLQIETQEDGKMYVRVEFGFNNEIIFFPVSELHKYFVHTSIEGFPC